MKKMLIALPGAVCLLTQISTAGADRLQDIEKRGTIRIAVSQDFPPFGSLTGCLTCKPIKWTWLSPLWAKIRNAKR